MVEELSRYLVNMKLSNCVFGDVADSRAMREKYLWMVFVQYGEAMEFLKATLISVWMTVQRCIFSVSPENISWPTVQNVRQIFR